MKTVRMTMAQALVKFLDQQYLELDGEEIKFVAGVFGIFGHGVVVGLGEALAAGGHGLRFYQAKTEQGAGHAAIGFAKQSDRRRMMAVTSSLGPGALKMRGSASRPLKSSEPKFRSSASASATKRLGLPSVPPSQGPLTSCTVKTASFFTIEKSSF